MIKDISPASTFAFTESTTAHKNRGRYK